MIKYADLGNYKVKDAIKTQSNDKVNWLMVQLGNKM